MAAGTAQRLGLQVDGSFRLRIGGAVRAATHRQLGATAAGLDTLLLADIAQAQEWLGLFGRLSRIDVRVPAGAAGEQALEAAARDLPRAYPPSRRTAHEAKPRHDGRLHDEPAGHEPARAARRRVPDLQRMSFAVVQRRRVIGVLRALGATRARVLAMILTEACMLGIVGAALGLVLGIVIGRELVASSRARSTICTSSSQ